MRIEMNGISIVALVILTLDAHAEPRPVKIDTGFVRGVVDDNVVEYKGIPFAAPPLGNQTTPPLAIESRFVWRPALAFPGCRYSLR